MSRTSRVKLALESPRRGRPRVRVRHWLLLAVALVALNVGVTFHNVWPTLWVVPAAELSIELAVLTLVLVAWTSFMRPVGRVTWWLLTLLVLVFVLGRYAEVTAPALYGRPVNLYWDAQHLPKIAAMLATVGPWWLVLAGAVGFVALITALIAAIRWSLACVGHVLSERMPRRVLGALAILVIAHFTASHALGWPSWPRYSLPVAETYRQQASFIVAAYTLDQNRVLPVVPLAPSNLKRLEGDDVLLMFLESYGAITYDAPAIARVVAPARDELAHAAADTGRRVVSAYAASPTFGGGSWLAHATFMSGMTVSEPGDYALLLTQQRDTWAKAFKRAGYRAIGVMPGMKSSWPEGAFYGFDAIYDEQAVDYRGPDFGWWRIPDQFALANVEALEARTESHAPRFTFFPTINTHIPFLPVPPYQKDWQQLLTAEPFEAEAVAASLERVPDWEALGGPYAESFVYTFTYLAGYLREHPGADEILLLIGDHQPAASVTGLDARWDVPVHIVTQRDDVATALLAAGFVEGVALAPQQRPVVTMAELSALLLRTFDAPQSP
jgi:hypothetical protein